MKQNMETVFTVLKYYRNPDQRSSVMSFHLQKIEVSKT